MSLTESQLSAWSSRGAVTTAEQTHQSIRNALETGDSLIKDKNFEIYLQGSYKNSTNIRGDSDVDVVVQLNTTISSDTFSLPSEQKTAFNQAYITATYLWENFRADVLATLKNYYGNAVVKEGKKCIKILPTTGRLPADVIPCLQHRRYIRFDGYGKEEYVEGIKFWSLPDKKTIINYPKKHYENGALKNQRAKNCFKPLVRVFKNARTFMAESGIIDKNLAPSYFLENFLYNVPDNKYSTSLQMSYLEIINWLASADLSQFICQNHQINLFGSSDQQWDMDKARELIRAYWLLWERGK